MGRQAPGVLRTIELRASNQRAGVFEARLAGDMFLLAAGHPVSEVIGESCRPILIVLSHPVLSEG